MNHLLRGSAPISDGSWRVLDEEARQRLEAALAARKLVDFSGPHGWEYSSTNLGRARPVDSAPGDGVYGLQRRVLPVVELRADFAVDRAELRDADRGSDDTDLEALDKAAHQIAVAENVAVFHGWHGAIAGIEESSPYEQATLGEAAGYPTQVAGAVEKLLCSGITGPYGLALGREQYRRVVETAEHGGYPLFDHLTRSLRVQSCGRRASTVRSSSACVAATSCSSPDKTYRSATTLTTRTWCASTWRRVSVSTWRRPRRPSR